MRRFWIPCCCASMICAAIGAAGDVQAAEPAPVNLATLEWHPYTGSELPAQGAVSDVVRLTFETADIKIKLSFHAWKDAVDVAAGGWVDGYFPGYHCKHHPTGKFIASDPISKTSLGFAFHKKKRLRHWQGLQSAAGKTVGYVKGYASTPEFEAMEKAKEIGVIRADSDSFNMQQLAKRQLDLVLIDEYVFEYLIKTDPAVMPHRKQLSFHPRPIDIKNLYLCLRDTPKHRALMARFNAALAGLNPEKLIYGYFRKVF